MDSTRSQHYYYENKEQYHRTLSRLRDQPSPDLTEFFVFGMKGLMLELQDLQFYEKKTGKSQFVKAIF